MHRHTQVLKDHFEEMRTAVKENYSPEGQAKERLRLFKDLLTNLKTDKVMSEGTEKDLLLKELGKVYLENEQLKKQIR